MTNTHKLSPFIVPLLSLIIGIYIQSVAAIATLYLFVGFCLLGCALVTIIVQGWKLATLVILNCVFLCAGCLGLSLQHAHTQKLIAAVANSKVDALATVIDRHLQALTKPRWKQNEVLELAVIACHPASDNLTPSRKTTTTNVLDHPVQPEYFAQHNVLKGTFNLQCFVKYTTNVQVGDTILLKNITIKQPKPQVLSGNPSYSDYLIKEGFLSSIFLFNTRSIKILERPKWNIRRWWWSIRNTTFQNIMNKLSPRAANYYSLIFLGKKDPDSANQLRRTFNFWGLSHYLARSGLHIVLFVLIWKFILSFLPIHLTIKRIVLIVVCGTYGLLSWPSTPFIRAFSSFLLSETGRLFNFNVHFFHLLTIICLLMLLFNPMQLFFLDFQLTFGITFALAWLSLYSWQTSTPNKLPYKK